MNAPEESVTQLEPEIEILNVSKEYRRGDGSVIRALSDVSRTFLPGQFVCVVGPSGHGKSTLLHLIAGLVDPTEGEIRVRGRLIDGPGPDRGMVFQKDSVFPWMRVRDNVAYGLAMKGVDKRRRAEVADAYLTAVGLEGWERAWPRELSGGMLKRVAVATVFATGADVLLLDEPFSMLDYVTKRQLHRVLLDLWAEDSGAGLNEGQGPPHTRRTVVFVTHDVDEALTLSDRLIVIVRGRIVEDLSISAGRPRTDDDLARPEILRVKHVLLRHLGLETTTSSEIPEGAV